MAFGKQDSSLQIDLQLIAEPARQSTHDSANPANSANSAKSPSVLPQDTDPAFAGSRSAEIDIPEIDIPEIDLLSVQPLPELPPVSPTGRSSGPELEIPYPADSPPEAEPKFESSRGSEPSRNAFWLSGDVIMCACPDCRAPMTVRLWLMLADCWQCGASIELTEQEERSIQRLLSERARVKAAEPSARGKPSVSPAKKRLTQHVPPGVTPPPIIGRPARQRPQPVPTDSPGDQAVPPASVTRAERRARQLTETSRFRHRALHALRLSPAWLVSLVLHLLLLTLLALLTLKAVEQPLMITLSPYVDDDVREGALLRVAGDDDSPFELPLPSNVDLSNSRVRRSMVRADQDARQLRMDPDGSRDNIPPLPFVLKRVQAQPRRTTALAARDPRVRIQLLLSEGGTTLTEAAVYRGLKWLSEHQNEDGRWSLHTFDHPRSCRCGQTGRQRNDVAATSLALLPFLGAGQTHDHGIFRHSVSRGLRWLMRHQASSGYLRADSRDKPGMYAHGQGAIVLCEAFALTGDETLRDAAQRAIDFIVDAQYSDGGWRYAPLQTARGANSQGDTSIAGWQLMALQSARAAQLEMPEETSVLAQHFLDAVQYKTRKNESTKLGALYGYTRGHRFSPAMTAEALLGRIYLGWTTDTPTFQQAVDWLCDEHLPNRQEPNMYYWYYATQVMHHWGGERWQQWNETMSQILIETQETNGHAAGSWPIRDPRTRKKLPWGEEGGRLYVTSLAVCTLEVYYRHLPLFRQIDLAPPEHD